MLLEDYHPIPALVRPEHLPQQPRFPVIDAHNHLGNEFGGGWIHRPLPELLNVLDQACVYHYVDLDGGWGEAIFDEHLRRLQAHVPQRFSIFCGVDWQAWQEKGNRFGEWAAAELRRMARRGAAGLKV